MENLGLRGKVRIGGRTLVVRVIVHFTQTLATLSLPLKGGGQVSSSFLDEESVVRGEAGMASSCSGVAPLPCPLEYF